MVDFAGWCMPLHYGSQVQEHHTVRRVAGMFDVSHMTIIDIEGLQARQLLRRLLVTDIDRLQRPGMALYSCMLNEHGGVIDDLIVYRLEGVDFRLVSNAGTRTEVLNWIKTQGQNGTINITERRDLAMIAVQGPRARELTLNVLDAGMRARAQDLAPFTAHFGEAVLIARTGYTGEDGYEIMVPGGSMPSLWNALLAEGVAPAGLGARDTLRLEAGMNLYGADLDQGTSPLACGLGWTVSWAPEERRFIGREALERQRRDGPAQLRFGLVLCAPGVLRARQRVVLPGDGSGIVTSGGFAPTLGRSIALARLPVGAAGEVQVEIRDRWTAAKVVDPPFVRDGHPRVLMEETARA